MLYDVIRGELENNGYKIGGIVTELCLLPYSTTIASIFINYYSISPTKKLHDIECIVGDEYSVSYASEECRIYITKKLDKTIVK